MVFYRLLWCIHFINILLKIVRIYCWYMVSWTLIWLLKINWIHFIECWMMCRTAILSTVKHCSHAFLGWYLTNTCLISCMDYVDNLMTWMVLESHFWAFDWYHYCKSKLVQQILWPWHDKAICLDEGWLKLLMAFFNCYENQVLCTHMVFRKLLISCPTWVNWPSYFPSFQVISDFQCSCWFFRSSQNWLFYLLCWTTE